MSEPRWKFQVEGTFSKGGRPVFPCEAIIESGDRTDGSPFKFRGVGPVAKADENGRFRSWYVTEGSAEAVARPNTVSVYVRVDKGAWQPIVVNVEPDSAKPVSHDEMRLELGSVVMPNGMRPYVQDA
jgi:hypothetical protein